MKRNFKNLYLIVIPRVAKLMLFHLKVHGGFTVKTQTSSSFFPALHHQCLSTKIHFKIVIVNKIYSDLDGSYCQKSPKILFLVFC